ncbi:MAG: Protein yippee-like 2 [Geoglossum umbratile]|nr:MAG: Protein yippee-like 2 [Geoglossum umbratile]
MAPFPSFSQRSSGTSSSSSPPLTTQNLKFPTFLLPSIPFRRRPRPQPAYRRDGSSDSGISSTSTEAEGTEQIEPGRYLTGHTSMLHCARCAADLCHTSQIISKGFTGRHGRAYLVSSSPTASTIPNHTLPNTLLHAPTPRHLVTGLHTVSDVSCIFCASVLGWKYVAAEEEAQRYKVGKFILETRRVRGGVGWEGRWDDGTGIVDGVPAGEEAEEVVEFDSEDEDECEDLFAGVWTAEGARRRRRGRARMGVSR